MKILVTSGGTRERIDEVRLITNISTGRLGADIAQHLLAELRRSGSGGRPAEVHYLHSESAVVPNVAGRETACCLHRHVANSTAEVYEAMEHLVPRMDAVIHAMAVSDFTFEPSDPEKLSSHDAEGFVENLRARIRPSPKIIAEVRRWNPDVVLVGFKFEVGRTTRELIEVGMASLERNGADLVLCNDKLEMKRAGCHIGHLVRADGRVMRAHGKLEIAWLICSETLALLRRRQRPSPPLGAGLLENRPA